MIKIFRHSWPLLLGIAIVLILSKCNVPSFIIFRIEFVLDSIITWVTTLTGFIITSISIIISMSSSSIIQEISKKDGINELIYIFTQALLFSIAVIVYFIVLGAFIDSDGMIESKWITYSIGMLTAYIFCIGMTCVYLLQVIKQIPSSNIIKYSNIPSKPEGEYRLNSKE